VIAGGKIRGSEFVFGGYVRNQLVSLALERYLFTLLQVGKSDQDIVIWIKFQHPGWH
jgi:hypothetical protein